MAGSDLKSLARAATNGNRDPLDALEFIDTLRVAVEDYERELVIAARNEGHSWEEIGAALGVPRQNVHRRHGHADPRHGVPV